jgi:hypothetical protein
MFMEVLLQTSVKTFLELHLGSESKNYGALRSSAHVSVILNDRLQKEHGQGVQKRVEFDAMLNFPWGYAVIRLVKNCTSFDS